MSEVICRGQQHLAMYDVQVADSLHRTDPQDGRNTDFGNKCSRVGCLSNINQVWTNFKNTCLI